MAHKPMTVTSRGDTIRDFAIFQAKLLMDGGKDLVAFWASIIAIVLDFVAGRGKKPRLFYSVVRASERFESRLDLHSVVREVDEEAYTGEGVLGASRGGQDTFLTEIERLVRGTEADRAKAIRMLRSRGGGLKRRILDEPVEPE